MNSSIISISEILSNSHGLLSARFSQRYNFDAMNAQEYFDELIESSQFPSPIFSGILIMKKEGSKFVIIDGLQRVTTICLLLSALCENYKDTSSINTQSSEKIYQRYLLNNNSPKLKLVEEEKFTYKKILFSERLTEKEEQSNLAQAYKAFLYKIKERKMSGTELFRVISKIQFMVVLTESGEISARDLYQAINSKDKPQINLISDFIHHRGDEEATEMWNQVLALSSSTEMYEEFESFMKDFLVIQNEGKVPNRNALYNNFKSYFARMSKYMEDKTIISNIVRYAGYYFRICNADFDDEEIKEQIVILNQNGGRDAYSYVMGVMDDVDGGHLEKETFLNLLKSLNAYIKEFREVSGESAVIDFASLSSELNRMLIMRDSGTFKEPSSKVTINDITNL